MTRQAFNVQMKRLSGLKFAPALLDTHWEALLDIPELLLQAAVEHAQRESEEFPSPKMLRMYADQLRPRVIPVPPEDDRGVDLAAPVVIGTLPTGQAIRQTREWKYYCLECQDAGWMTVWCGSGSPSHPWVTQRQTCERRFEHGGHEWSYECPCAPTNPDVQRRRARAFQVKRGQDAA